MRTFEFRRFFQGAAVAAAIAMASPGVASAQANTAAPANDMNNTGYAQTTQDDDGTDWGWLGLLGLAGLLGLRRRDHVDHVDRTDRTTTRGPMT